jgi:hypothetical protein
MSQSDIDDLDARYQAFLDHNVRKPSTPLPPGDPSPVRTTTTLRDIIKPNGPDPREVHGAMLAPQMVHRHGLDKASPAPFVSTSPAAAFPYREAKTGRTVVPGPKVTTDDIVEAGGSV